MDFGSRLGKNRDPGGYDAAVNIPDAEVPSLTSPARPPVSANPAVGHARVPRPGEGEWDLRLSAEDSKTHTEAGQAEFSRWSRFKTGTPRSRHPISGAGNPCFVGEPPSQIRAERLHYTLI